MSSTSSHHDDEPLEPARLARLEAALAGLGRRRAPHSLKALVAAHLAGDEEVLAQRAAASIACLEPLTAPAELRARVVDELATQAPVAELLRGLEYRSAPHVLRRLVEEEVADPKAPLERFVRSLPRQSGPRRESIRLSGGAADAPRGTLVLLSSRSWRAAAAALVLGAIGLASFQFTADGDSRRDRPAFRLQRQFVDDASALSPMARGLVMGMAPDTWIEERVSAARDGGAR